MIRIVARTKPIGVSCTLVLAALCVHPARAAAGCSSHAEARAGSKRRKLLQKCNARRLRSRPGASCKTSAPPACVGSLVTDAMRLAYGANDPAPAAVDHKALHDQLRCQQATGKGGATITGTRRRHLIEGNTTAEHAQTHTD